MSSTDQPHPHLHLTPDLAALATDLYQLTMMYAYFTADIDSEATFELFVRRLPKRRRFLVAAGLEQVVAYLRDLHFDGAAIDYLRQTPTFAQVGDPAQREAFFERLRDFSFKATVRALPEGTIFFPNEPAVQVTGSLLEGQLVETYMLSAFNYQTLVASKAARVRLAAGERTLADFGSRRAHGPQAGIYAARAAFVGGFDATSNVAAGFSLGVPIVGTAAHAYTMAFPREEDAFAHYTDTFPASSVLLIDTYDMLRGARRAAAMGERLKGVRLDSGDLGEGAKQVRAILDAEGLHDATIVASSDLNEYRIQEMLADGAPIDVFGVGTELVTSKDDPTLAGVYKLVEKRIDGQLVPTMKFSSAKNSYPGRKDLYRLLDAQGAIVGGALCQAGEHAPEAPEGGRAVQMLETVMESGAIVQQRPTLEAIRQRTLDQLKTLPESLRALGPVEAGAWKPRLDISGPTQEKIAQCTERFDVEAAHGG